MATSFKSDNDDKSLFDLGEIDILNNIIFPFHKRPDKLPNVLGDDCVDFPSNALKDRIVWTIDPTPLPISCLIGNSDYYIFGWYSVLINLSDIASMGASPFGLLLSVTAPPEMKVGKFKRFLKGVEDCCRMQNTYILGGNIKDGKEFSCVGTALGSVNRNKILTRRGCNKGDFIVAIGEVGAFWAAVFSQLQKMEFTPTFKKKMDDALNKPIPRLNEGKIISKYGLATSCMDNSDSIVTCCYELAYQNNLDFIVTIKEQDINPIYREIFNKSGVNPLTTVCSWGDWNLICTVPPNKFKELQEKLKPFCAILKIGDVRNLSNMSKKGKAYYLFNDELRPLNKDIGSERFQKQSYFTHGIDKYYDVLRNQRLWV